MEEVRNCPSIGDVTLTWDVLDMMLSMSMVFFEAYLSGVLLLRVLMALPPCPLSGAVSAAVLLCLPEADSSLCLLLSAKALRMAAVKGLQARNSLS